MGVMGEEIYTTDMMEVLTKEGNSCKNLKLFKLCLTGFNVKTLAIMPFERKLYTEIE